MFSSRDAASNMRTKIRGDQDCGIFLAGTGVANVPDSGDSAVPRSSDSEQKTGTCARGPSMARVAARDRRPQSPWRPRTFSAS